MEMLTIALIQLAVIVLVVLSFLYGLDFYLKSKGVKISNIQNARNFLLQILGICLIFVGLYGFQHGNNLFGNYIDHAQKNASTITSIENLDSSKIYPNFWQSEQLPDGSRLVQSREGGREIFIRFPAEVQIPSSFIEINEEGKIVAGDKISSATQ